MKLLGQFVARQGYGSAFIDDHLVPMGAVIWSASVNSMMNFPVRAFMRFMENHKLLNFIDRPQWRTVAGGSREYVKRIAAPCRPDKFEHKYSSRKANEWRGYD